MNGASPAKTLTVDLRAIPLERGDYVLLYDTAIVAPADLAVLADWAAERGIDLCFVGTSDVMSMRLLRVEPKEMV